MGVGSRLPGLFRPGAEVEGQQLAPGIQRFKVFVGESRVIERPGEVEPEIMRRRHHSVGSGSRLYFQDAAQYVFLLLLRKDNEKHAKNVGLLAEDLAIGILRKQ